MRIFTILAACLFAGAAAAQPPVYATPKYASAYLMSLTPSKPICTDSTNLLTTACSIASLGANTFTAAQTAPSFVSTVATGTAPLAVTSTTAVANLNASLLLGGTWASPGAIGSTTPAAGTFTSVTTPTFTASTSLVAGGTLAVTGTSTFTGIGTFNTGINVKPQDGISFNGVATFGLGQVPASFATALRVPQTGTYADNLEMMQNSSYGVNASLTGCVFTSGNPTVTGCSSTTGAVNGNFLLPSGPVASGVSISGLTSSGFTMSKNALSSTTASVTVMQKNGNAAIKFNDPLFATNSEVGAIGYSHNCSYGQGFFCDQLYAEIGNLRASPDIDDTDFAIDNDHNAGASHFSGFFYTMFKAQASTGNFFFYDHLAATMASITESNHVFEVFGGANNLSLIPSTAGTPVAITASGSDTNILLRLNDKGSAGICLASNGNYALCAQNSSASAVNWVSASGSATGGAVRLFPGGTDGTIPINIEDVGGAGVILKSNGVNVASFINPASPTIYPTFTSISTGDVQIGVAGTGVTNHGIRVNANGTGGFSVGANSQVVAQFKNTTSSALEFLTVFGNATGQPVILSTGTNDATTPNMRINPLGNVLGGTGSILSTTATTGMTGIACTSGAPTAAPSAIGTGDVMIVADCTNHNLWIYIFGTGWVEFAHA